MQGIIDSIKGAMSFNKLPILTILANVFWGLALGKIFITPGNELVGSLLVKVLMIMGTCLFANYLMCLRKAFKGISRNPTTGKLRPFLRDAAQCAVLNACVFIFAMTLFFIKPYFQYNEKINYLYFGGPAVFKLCPPGQSKPGRERTIPPCEAALRRWTKTVKSTRMYW